MRQLSIIPPGSGRYLRSSFGSGNTFNLPCQIILDHRMFYTYVLQSLKDKKFYTGYTSDLKLRFEKHIKGLVPSTKDGCPLKIVYYEACLNRNDATHREKYLKTHYGKTFIKSRLKSYLIGRV